MHINESLKLIENISYQAVKWTASSWAFVIVFCFTLTWLAFGPFLKFSVGWQLTMGTISSTITFLMVFLLQRSQNKDYLAMQIKLNEIIASQKGANNHLINIENLSEAEIAELQKRYQTVATHIHDNKEGVVSTEKISVEEIAQEVENLG